MYKEQQKSYIQILSELDNVYSFTANEEINAISKKGGVYLSIIMNDYITRLI